MSFAKENEFIDEKSVNINFENRNVLQIVEDEPFIPAKCEDSRILYGSLNNYYPLIRYFYTIYERLKLANRLISERVEEKFKTNPDIILSRAKRIKGSNQISNEEAKQFITKELISILFCITYTKGKNLIEGQNFEDMV